MDIELHQDRFQSSRYDAVPQGNLDSASDPDPHIERRNSSVSSQDNRTTPRGSSSLSRPGLYATTSQESCRASCKLPPKPYIRPPPGIRIRQHALYATIFLVRVSVPFSLYAPVIIASSDNANTSLDSTYCPPYPPNWQIDATMSIMFAEILNVDIPFGTFSFGMAKFIDLLWDIIVSRGGQALLAWITYQVHTAALMRIMESKMVTYDLYLTMTFSWSSIWSIKPMMAAIVKKLGWRNKTLFAWLIISTLWVVVWPTITNAMTGYVAENDVLILLQNGSGYANCSDLVKMDNLVFEIVGKYTNTSIKYDWKGPLITSWGMPTLWQQLENGKSIILTPKARSLTYTIDVIESQSLAGISASPENFRGPIPENNGSGTIEVYEVTYFPLFYFENATYDGIYLSNPSINNEVYVAKGSYQWGFSMSVTLYFAILNGLWVIGTYAVWVHMNRKGEMCSKGRRMGKYRAAVDMAEAMTNELGRDICAYSNDELEDVLEKREGGVMYAVTRSKDASHIGLIGEQAHEKLRLEYGELYGG